MKRYVTVLLCFVLGGYAASGQGAKSIRVSSGEDIAQAYSPQGFYRLPQFTAGVIFFKGGGKNSDHRLNYNLLSNTIQFIHKSGDTLEMTSPATIDSVVINGGLVYHQSPEGFVEIIPVTDSVRLGKKINIEIQMQNVGAYGMSNPTASIVNIRNYTTNNNVFSLTINQDVVVDENIKWLVAGADNAWVESNKANLLKALPSSHQPTAEAYFRQNKVNFKKEADLKKLVAALQR